MKPRRSHSSRIAPVCLAVLLGATFSTASAAVTTYPDLESFLAALGSITPTHQDFDTFEPGTTISDQIPGVVFSSPNDVVIG